MYVLACVRLFKHMYSAFLSPSFLHETIDVHVLISIQAASDSGEEATDSAAAHSQTEGDRQSQSFQFGGKLRVKSGDAVRVRFLMHAQCLWVL